MTGDALEEAANAAQTAVTADAVGSELKGGRRRAGEHCANCGAPLEGPYCFACGQYDDDLRRPIWALAGEVIEGLFSLDGRVLNTVPPLLWRPGHVTSRYLAGERARFVAPFRLYLIASLIFFVMLALFGDFSLNPADRMNTEQAQAEFDQAAQELSEARERAEESGNAEEAAGLAVAERMLSSTRAATERAMADSETQLETAEKIGNTMTRETWKRDVRAALTPEDVSESELQQAEENGADISFGGAESMPLEQRRWLVTRINRIIDDPSRLGDAMERWAPRLLFVLLPVYALILAGMHFWRRDFVFYDHLVVSLHAHAFFFLLMTGLIIAGIGLGGVLTTTIFIIWSNFYIYRMHRRVYRHGRLTSVLRTLVLDFVYMIVLTLSLVILFFLGVAFV